MNEEASLRAAPDLQSGRPSPPEPGCNSTFARFGDWTRLREPIALGTNSGSPPLAFQNWRRFKEAFAPELVARAIEEGGEALGRPVASCLDPFGGSGTTALAAQFLGVTPTTIEVNPFLADLIEAKIACVDIGRVASSLSEVLSAKPHPNPRDFYKGAPRTFVEPGLNDRFLFSYELAARMAGLLTAIFRLDDIPVQRLLRVLLGSAALEVSNVVISGKGRRYRRNWQLSLSTPSDLDFAFISLVQGAAYDISRFSNRQAPSYRVIRGDSRSCLPQLETVDLIVTSPPYPNSFDYTDVYNIELWAMAYLRTGDDNRRLRNMTMRSHVQIKRDMGIFEADSESITRSITLLRAAPGLWNVNIPSMIGGYFLDLKSILEHSMRVLPRQGRIMMVVGDSQYAGITVPVAQGLKELALKLGFEMVSSEPFRSMRSSPQQGGRLELPETLLTLSKP